KELAADKRGFARIRSPSKILNIPMHSETLTYLNAIEHLPGGGTLILTSIPWQDYEELVDNLSEWPGVRVCYDQGRLEIMAPTFRHESLKGLVSQLCLHLP